jgi:hypothetical protein
MRDVWEGVGSGRAGEGTFGKNCTFFASGVSGRIVTLPAAATGGAASRRPRFGKFCKLCNTRWSWPPRRPASSGSTTWPPNSPSASPSRGATEMHEVRAMGWPGQFWEGLHVFLGAECGMHENSRAEPPRNAPENTNAPRQGARTLALAEVSRASSGARARIRWVPVVPLVTLAAPTGYQLPALRPSGPPATAQLGPHPFASRARLSSGGYGRWRWSHKSRISGSSQSSGSWISSALNTGTSSTSRPLARRTSTR